LLRAAVRPAGSRGGPPNCLVVGKGSAGGGPAPAIVEEATSIEAATLIGPVDGAASNRQPVEREGASGRNVEEAERRSAGPFNNGRLGPGPPDRERAGNRGETIRAIGGVIDRRQGVGARRQGGRIPLAVRIRGIDRRDQTRHVAGRTRRIRRLDRSSRHEGTDERGDDQHTYGILDCHSRWLPCRGISLGCLMVV